MSVNEYKQKDYSTESKQGAVVCFIIGVSIICMLFYNVSLTNNPAYNVCDDITSEIKGVSIQDCLRYSENNPGQSGVDFLKYANGERVSEICNEITDDDHVFMQCLEFGDTYLYSRYNNFGESEKALIEHLEENSKQFEKSLQSEL